MDLLKGLNPRQREAVTLTEGAVRVVAGPGTGKTRTLTARYAHLVSGLGIPPKNILCATFTNKAAQEMKNRIRKSLGDMDLGLISTFHSFCRLFLRDEIHHLKLPQNFVIIDQEDQKAILSKVYAEMGLTLKDLSFKEAIDTILEARKMEASSYVRDFLELNNENIRERFQGGNLSRDGEIFLRYIYEQKKNFSLDFNDLINFASHILNTVPEVRERWQDRLQYVMIDEFQDVSLRQYKLGDTLAGLHGNIFIVGDSDQTIYTWRGAHHRIFQDFPNNYPSCKTIVLEDNYRSTPEILATADTLIKNNQLRFGKTLTATKLPGDKPIFHHAKNEGDEADWILDKIQSVASKDPNLKNIAILCRSHYLTRSLEHSLVRGKIPYRVISGTEFYHRKEIKDAICYLRMISGADDMAFGRVINEPSRKIGKKSLDKITEFATRNDMSLYESLKSLAGFDLALGRKAKPFIGLVEGLKAEKDSMGLSDLFQKVLDLSGYEAALRLRGDNDRLDNLAELKRGVDEFGSDPENTLEDFLHRSALFTNLDRERGEESVSVMTIHAAKGLEFRTVFVLGLSEGIFPSRRVESPEEMEEERRLLYVAMTRAKKRLFLSCAEGFTHDGLRQAPSRFLFEIRSCLKGDADNDMEALKSGVGGRGFQGPSYDTLPFKAGDRVEHNGFGVGRILKADPNDGAYLIQFDSIRTPRSVSFGTAMRSLPE
ncbi:MAG: UvrD-helicase domain-containing protein [Deltaproteobacteria bacterium]|jgi:DNA helicase-2/ATP-dependent DNA helicase PcrA|nr:UvrD-helicase domain-containing protein [Deltaproteobacteria bacterium]